LISGTEQEKILSEAINPENIAERLQKKEL
jgi:regulator of extracellular matrix RemA (YlzA/DUF370 family)